jgi:O-antigen/teichoic acid export membrane protein
VTSAQPFEKMSLTSIIARNTAWSALAVVATPVLAFLFGGLTLRYLGLEIAGYGLAVGAIYSIAARFGTLGLGQAVLPRLAAAITAGDEHRARSLIGILLLVFTASGFAGAVGFLLLAPVFNSWTNAPVATSTATIYIGLCGFAHALGQVNLALATVLRAANRYDLVTAATTPLAFVTGLTACTLLPFYPSLLTMATISATAALLGVLIVCRLVIRTVPLVLRPLPGFGEIPGLIGYAGWLLGGNLLAVLTNGADDLLIAASCGVAGVPVWAIGKRLWMTVHTFLAQHVEHLVPLLGGLGLDERARVERIAHLMHWYVMMAAAGAFTFMAWSGPAIVGLVAGGEIGQTSQSAIRAFGLFGLCFALAIVPVTVGLARGRPRLSFQVTAILQISLFLPLALSALFWAGPSIYYAPLFGSAALLPLLGWAFSGSFGSQDRVAWLKPVTVPVGLAAFAIMATSLATMADSALLAVSVGCLMAMAVLATAVLLERVAGVNVDCHARIGSLARQCFDRAAQRVRFSLGRRHRVRT